MNLIFDIDGTLVASYDFDGELYLATIKEVLGDIKVYRDWRKYQHVTDAGILDELCVINHIVDSVVAQAEVRQVFGNKVCAYLQTHACQAIPGAPEFITRLKKSDDYNVGFATGGWGHTARMKLQAAGFDITDISLASSDDHYERETIMQICRSRMARGGDGNNVVYFGDGLWDVYACARLGWKFIGIGERLKGHCDNWYQDFTMLQNDWF